MIRTINNAVRTLLIQENLPTSFWVEALHAAVHILNLLPSSTINGKFPFSALFNKPLSYYHLRVFGSLCYPHTNQSNKLEPRSTPSVFLGYPLLHWGYRCFYLKTRKIIISRHVTFDESIFPYKITHPQNELSYNFLQIDQQTSQFFRDILLTPTSHLQSSSPINQINSPSSSQISTSPP